jgi:prolyl-tRNA editing enzyme YbaK/EbsC (Cys-tRNA(Pro) deacylase)
VNPVLVVLDLRSSVDKTKLAKYLNTQPKHMRMATPELVIEVTGQTVGNVSPIGHKQAVRTIVDAALLRENGMSSADIGAEVSDVVCYGGGGSTGRELRIGLRELLAVSKAEIADVSVAVSTDGNTAESPTEPVAAPISTPVDTAGTS